MARKSVNTTPATTTKTSKREYDLNHFVDGLNDPQASNTRRVYCAAQAIVRLFKDSHEQVSPAEDAAWLAATVASMASLATPAALAADAKAGRGVNTAAASRNKDAVIADLMRQLAEAQARNAAPATPPETPKRGRKV